ncbi:MAG TPA: hypothetical protein VJ932_05785 [Alkalispirochaeta sp.]|nr:hypothetical protein [Alkalispirochaeta sp.]
MQDQERIIAQTIRLMERTVILVFGISLLLALMFVAGNYQEFADATQLQLLRALQGLSGSVVVGGIMVAVLTLIEAIKSRGSALLVHTVANLVMSGVSFGLAVGSSSLLVLFRPL